MLKPNDAAWFHYAASLASGNLAPKALVSSSVVAREQAPELRFRDALAPAPRASVGERQDAL